MGDERKSILRALRGPATVTYDPMGLSTMVDRLGEELLPTGLDLETAAVRLLSALQLRQRGAPLKRVLSRSAEKVGMYLSRDDPKGPKGAAKIERLLREVDRTTSAMSDWTDRMESKGRAVVIRAQDPGVSNPEACCDSCGMPNLAVASIDRLEQDGYEWTLAVFPEETES